MEPETQTEVSPIVHTAEMMSFPEAIAEATIGKRIQRVEWHDSEYGFFRANFLHIHKDGDDHIWQISMGDAVADDWVTL